MNLPNTIPSNLPVCPPIEIVCTPNLHLATLLATLGCKPQQILRGPERTPQGTPKVKWVYKSDAEADQIVSYWQHPEEPDWSALSDDMKRAVVNIVSAFAGNLKHFLAHTKQQEKAK